MFFFCYNFFSNARGDFVNYTKYLYEGISNPSIFKNTDIKMDIICNPSRHEITWFCQDNNVTSEMINNLLDTEGVSILHNSEHYLNKVNGIISCGKDLSKLYDNKEFLDMLVKLDSYYFYLKGDEALKFINYCISNNLDVSRYFCMLDSKAQVYVISKCDLSKYYYDILVDSSAECSKIILDKISTLDNYGYNELLCIFEKGIYIPEKLFDRSLVGKISSMYNVKDYRNLMNHLSKANDTFSIERMRQLYCDDFLRTCYDTYKCILNDYKNGVSIDVALKKNLNGFSGYDHVLNNMHDGKGIENKLVKSFNYVTTDLVVDYIFHDYSYNVFIDMNELLRFNESTDILSPEDASLYSNIVSLDSMKIIDKIRLLNKLKGLNMESKFYDDYKRARDKMVDLFNKSILNKDNVGKYRNNELSLKYGVPVYEMNGNDFYVFVKSLDMYKDTIVTDKSLRSYHDSGSFSIDGSNKLNVFQDTDRYYALVYNSIPKNQLIHSFEVDSYSNYYRDDNNIPRDNNGTDRINRLYTPQEFVGISSSYNELVVAQPNVNKNDEFEAKLEKPQPFALYCYDTICDNDVLSAKELGLGIVLVRTNKYSIDKSNRPSLHSFDDKDICYIKPNERDRRL